jgi:flagellar protein FlgJ
MPLTKEEQQNWFNMVTKAATKAGCKFPEYVAAEAALESNWGQSKLAREANNLLGLKQRKTPIYETISMPTKEIINGQEVVVQANWIKYPDIETCLKHRMKVLTTLAKVYPNYKKGLEASTGEGFVLNISKTWATDPDRGQKVLNIYNQYHTDPPVEEASIPHAPSTMDIAEEKVPTFKDYVRGWWNA